jgi:hypothetical protein
MTRLLKHVALLFLGAVANRVARWRDGGFDAHAEGTMSDMNGTRGER